MLHHILLSSVVLYDDNSSFLLCSYMAPQDNEEERVVQYSVLIMRRAGRSRATNGWNITFLRLFSPLTNRQCKFITVE